MATYYVNTASTAGGDGTTNATAGANRAFASLAEWEASGPRNLTGTGPEIVYCEGSTADTVKVSSTESVVITGWTTTASDYIDIKTTQANRHNGKYNTAKYRLEGSFGGFGNQWIGITVDGAHVRLSGLQLGGDASTAGDRYMRGIFHTGTVGEVIADSCIVKAIIANGSRSMYGVYGFTTGLNTKCYNCLSYVDGDGSAGCGYVLAGGTFTAYNCTVHGLLSGFWRAGGTFNCTNCGASTCTTAFDGTFASNVTGSSATPTYVDAANFDFHLASGDSTWKNQGTDLSGTFTTDIDGETRPTGAGTWDIGADEWISNYTGPRLYANGQYSCSQFIEIA